LLKFTATGVDADLRPLSLCPEVFALYLHFWTRAWAWCVPVAFAGVFIFTRCYEEFAIPAFLIWIHISPHFD